MMYIRFPLSLRQVEDLLHERGIDISYETVRAWWNRFGPMFANEIKKKRSASMRRLPQWRWRLDEVFIRINDEIQERKVATEIRRRSCFGSQPFQPTTPPL
jgi:putative transposase